MTYSALLACSLSWGAVPDFCSISAAHSAAPQVFVYANMMPAIGTISRSVATTPKPTFALACHAALPK